VQVNGLQTLNFKPLTVNSKPYTLTPETYTLNPRPWTLHPTPYTLHPKTQRSWDPKTLHTYDLQIPRGPKP